MKRIGTIVLTAICFMGIQLAMAGETSPPTEQSHVLPVLVAVNADGKVVRIDPAIHLRDRQMKELEKAVHTMITRPAMKDGHGIYSQFILQLAVSRTRPAPAGPHSAICPRGPRLRARYIGQKARRWQERGVCARRSCDSAE